MAKITQKQLIAQIKGLKEIKPRQEWAFLLKSQILAEKQSSAESFGETRQVKLGIMDIISSVFFQRKMAYSLATLVFLVVGVLGFAQYTMPGDLLFPIKKLAEQSQANLSGKTILNQDVAKLSSRINDLAQVAKLGKSNNVPSVISEISANASELAKSLKGGSADSATLKEIATSLKVLANVPGTDLSQSEDVKGLYETVVSGQIADLEKTTLTDEQTEILEKAKDLYKQKKYTDALEQILLINN